jgi:queuosine precursor transporter
MEGLILFLQQLQPEWVWLILLVFSYTSLMLMLRFFGVWGVTLYMAIALIAANLQVLKTVQFGLWDAPVALGTVLFSTTFLCTDILSEYYGPKAARRAVFLGFAGMLLLTSFMLLAVGFRPLPESALETGWAWGLQNHYHLAAVFQPIPSILLAGIVAYLCSQVLDIWIYQRIRSLTHSRFRWLRNNASTAVSALVDNIIFSILAWVVLAPEPMAWAVVWKTYILGTYGLRLVVALLDTPVLYLAGMLLPKSDDQQRIPG